MLLSKKMYEYGDGMYAEALEKRVQDRVNSFCESHIVVNAIFNWVPERQIGTNCFGKPVYKPRECYITFHFLGSEKDLKEPRVKRLKQIPIKGEVGFLNRYTIGHFLIKKYKEYLKLVEEECA